MWRRAVIPFLLLVASCASAALDEDCDVASPELCDARRVREGQAMLQRHQSQDLQQQQTEAIPIAQGDTIEWVNSIIAQLWPHVNNLVKGIIEDKVEPLVRSFLPDMLKGFEFSHYTLGNVAPKLGPIATYEALNDGTKLKITFNYNSDMHFELGWKYAKVGVKKLKLQGKLTVLVNQIIGEAPFVGGVVAYFVDAPTVTTQFTELMGGLDISIIKTALEKAIELVLKRFVVLPEHIPLAIAGPNTGADRALARSLPPRGILRVTLTGVNAGQNHDKGVTGIWGWATGDKSDIYAKFKLSGQEFKTSTIHNDLKPRWNRNNEKDFTVFDRDERLSIEVLDDDQVSRDDWVASVGGRVGDLSTGSHYKDFSLHNGNKEGGASWTTEWYGTDPGTLGNCDKYFLVVEVHGVDTDAFGKELIAKAVVEGGSNYQQTPSGGILKGVQDKLDENAVKQGAVFPKASVDGAMYFLLKKSDMDRQRIYITLLDASGKRIDTKLRVVSVKQVMNKQDLTLSDEHAFPTSKGTARVTMSVKVWGLTKNL